ncbi:MAG: HAD family hydrolase [bacterium]|nr:HAD family hydrolase [bacterium]
MDISKYKLVVSDIDGTLTPISQNAYPTDKVKNIIQKATNGGLIFTLASGRPYFLVKYLVDYLGCVGPCIVDNGAVIVDSKDGSVLWEANLSIESANKIIDLAKDMKLVRASCDIGGIDNPKNIPANTKVRKISIHDVTLEEAEKLMSTISDMCQDVVGVKAASYKGKDLVDVYFSNVSATKQFAVFKLAEILNIPIEKTIGIGDGYNDFSLLMACGLKVAMGNAVADLKEIADYVTLSFQEDGLVDVIEKYCSEYLIEN